MAHRVRVPGIVDVVKVSDPDEIRSLIDQQFVDRHFEGERVDRVGAPTRGAPTPLSIP